MDYTQAIKEATKLSKIKPVGETFRLLGNPTYDVKIGANSNEKQ